MKIYTRTGDSGETALFGGARVPKDHPRVEAYGTIDELNAVLGRALGVLPDSSFRERLAKVQHDLFALGAHLAAPSESPEKHPRLPSLPEVRPDEMEGWIDEAETELEPLTQFILPGGSPGAAELHVCRTVCRRAERAVVRLARGISGEVKTHDPAAHAGDDPAPALAVRYLNRLSDLLFVLARLENRRAAISDVHWQRESR